jgi:hypothetical protein
VAPTRGETAKIVRLLEALHRQTDPPSRREVILAFDGVEPEPAMHARLADAGVRIAILP